MVLQGSEQRAPGLFLTGTYFAEVSVAACVEQACKTADGIHDFLIDDAAESRSVAAGPGSILPSGLRKPGGKFRMRCLRE